MVKKQVLSYSLIKSKTHLTAGTFLQWVYWHTMINVCITSFNNSPDYSHNHNVYKHCLSFNNVLSWIVGSEVTPNTFFTNPHVSKSAFCFSFSHWFLFCFGEAALFCLHSGKSNTPLKIMRIKMLNFLNITGYLWNFDLGRKVSWNLIL